MAGILFVPLNMALEMETFKKKKMRERKNKEKNLNSKEERDYKELDPEGWEAYVEWCKRMEKLTGEKFYY